MRPELIGLRMYRPFASLALMLLTGMVSADCQYYQQLTHGPWRAVIDASGEDGCSLQTIHLALGTLERKLGEQTLKGNDPVSATWLRDLDGNKSPELVLITASAGSGSYARLRLFTADNNGLQVFELPPLPQPLTSEYRGHDHFLLHDDRIVREYPIYRDKDPNCCPSGGLRRQFYRFNGKALVLEP